MKFEKFNKISRLSRDITITEKIDGSNGQIVIISKADLALYGTAENDCDYKKENNFVEKHCLYIHPDNPNVEESDKLYLFAGSRNRWLDISSKGDNNGFAKWVKENAVDLICTLGEGRHFGEWYGQGIQRKYGLQEKRFALFNIRRWHDKRLEARLISVNPKTKEEKWTLEAPQCCEVVPILYKGMFDTEAIQEVLAELKQDGSEAVPGFMNPEGIILFHTASGQLFKKTIENDEKPKTL